MTFALPPRRQLRKFRFAAALFGALLCAAVSIGAAWQWHQQTQAPRERFAQTTEKLLALPARDVTGAMNLILSLPDPVEQGFEVELWIKQNRGRVDPGQAALLCGILPSEERSPCARRLSASHLQR
jgi:hypothetical protein